MKPFFLLTGFLLLFNHGYSQSDSCNNPMLCPIGITNGNSLEGALGSYLEYRQPDYHISVPSNFYFQDKLPYQNLLQAGLNSLFFEYKNYHGEVTESSYLIFGYGNYNPFKSEILDFLNQNVFGNRKILLTIFDWVLPYYQNVFQELTVEEQKILYNKSKQAEQYVQLVMKEKNKEKFEQWLLENGEKKDEKLVGFFERRVQKKQWTLADCEFWVKKVKDSFPKMKDEKLVSSHYQVIKDIENGIQIVTNHLGDYFITADQQNRVLTKEQKFIQYQPNDRSFLIYERMSNSNSTKYYLDENNVLVAPKDPSWKDWGRVTKNLIYAEKESDEGPNTKMLIHSKNSKILFTNFQFIFPRLDGKFIEVIQPDNHLKLLNYDGLELTKQELVIQITTVIDPISYEKEEIFIPIILYSMDGKFLIIENSKAKFGMIDENGIEILPFKYEKLEFSEGGKLVMVWKKLNATPQSYSLEKKQFLPSK